MAKLRKRQRSPIDKYLPNIILFVVIVVVLLVAAVAFVFGPANSLAAARSVGSDFMSALQANDFTTVYGMINSTYQAAFGSAAEMQTEFTNAGWVPSSFTLTQAQVVPSGKTVVSGTGIFAGATKYVSIYMLKDGSTFKVVGFIPEDNPPTAVPGA